MKDQRNDIKHNFLFWILNDLIHNEHSRQTDDMHETSKYGNIHRKDILMFTLNGREIFLFFAFVSEMK